MIGDEIALDTSQAIAGLNDIDGVRQWVQAFAEVYVPVPVVGELRFGALKSQRVMESLSRIKDGKR